MPLCNLLAITSSHLVRKFKCVFFLAQKSNPEEPSVKFLWFGKTMLGSHKFSKTEDTQSLLLLFLLLHSDLNSTLLSQE